VFFIDKTVSALLLKSIEKEWNHNIFTGKPPHAITTQVVFCLYVYYGKSSSIWFYILISSFIRTFQIAFKSDKIKIPCDIRAKLMKCQSSNQSPIINPKDLIKANVSKRFRNPS